MEGKRGKWSPSHAPGKGALSGDELADRVEICLWIRHALQKGAGGAEQPLGLKELGSDPGRALPSASVD